MLLFIHFNIYYFSNRLLHSPNTDIELINLTLRRHVFVYKVVVFVYN